jgi:hypothetical protein
MREAMGIDAYDKPFYSKAGYYAMYLLPPGKVGGGFGDLTAKRSARSNVPLVSSFAAQAQNGHWQWYVEQLGGPAKAGGYVGFIRGQLPQVSATHGYEANNSFLLWAYGKRLLIRSGYRDSYGSEHHKKWMWSTRSVNNITVNGEGQGRRTAKARGAIVAFKTTPQIDIVVGEAGQAYETPLERFTRAIIFVKPELMIVYDRLEAKEPSTYEYWLHAVNKFEIEGQYDIRARNGDVVCDIAFLTPSDLTFEQTDQYDPNPRPRIKLREWHLTARTVERKQRAEFVTVYWPHRTEDKIGKSATLRSIAGGYALSVKLADKKLTALLPTYDSATMRAPDGLSAKAAIKVKLECPDAPVQIVEVGEGDMM